MGGVDSLDALMNRREISADNDVNVALGGFLRVFHKSSFVSTILPPIWRKEQMRDYGITQNVSRK